MKYQALRPHFFSVVGGWRVLWVGGGGVGHGVEGGGVVGPHDTPNHGRHQMPPMIFSDNLVKKLDQIVKK